MVSKDGAAMPCVLLQIIRLVAIMVNGILELQMMLRHMCEETGSIFSPLSSSTSSPTLVEKKNLFLCPLFHHSYKSQPNLGITLAAGAADDGLASGKAFVHHACDEASLLQLDNSTILLPHKLP